MPTHLSAGADLQRVLLTAEDYLAWLDPEGTPSILESIARIGAQ